MYSKRASLALPLISIGLIVAGMTRNAYAASALPSVQSALDGVSLIEQLQQRIAERAASRRDEDTDAIQSMADIPRLRRQSTSSSVSSKSSKSSRRRITRSSSSVTLHGAASSQPVIATSEFSAEVFRLVNIERTKENLPAYTYNKTLEQSANEYAAHMKSITCFSHSECGSTLKERMHASGYYKANGRSYSYGENIARGQETPAEVMEDWLNSPPHKAAILSTKFKEIGIGFSDDYWVQHFGAVR